MLSDDSALRLAAHDGDVSLGSLQKFPASSTAAEALARKFGAQSTIYLDGLVTIDAMAAGILANERSGLAWDDCQFDVLRLSGITELSSEIAGHLSSRRGDLILNGLIQLSEEVAEKLADQRGRLNLDSLNSVSQEAALKLVSHKGDISVNTDVFEDSVAEVLSTHPSLFPINDDEDEDEDEDEMGISDSGGGDVSYHRMYFVSIKHLSEVDIIPAEFAEWLNGNLLNNEYYDFLEELFGHPDLMDQWGESVPNYPCPDSYIVVKQDCYMYVSGQDLEIGESYFGWTERPRRVDYKMQVTTELSSFSWRSI